MRSSFQTCRRLTCWTAVVDVLDVTSLRRATYLLQGEVLSGLQQKLKYMDRDGFNCLVAESRQTGELVGVVEVSLQADKVRIAHWHCRLLW